MKKRKISDRAVEYILTRKIDELRSLNAGKVAKSIGANSSYLSRCFETDQKISLGDFILREKIYRAIFILEKDFEISIAELSRELGFTQLDDFVREFRVIIAIDPEKYRDLRKIARSHSN